ncbi:MAG: hypothetical protein J6Q58_03875, partial [Clostridia bacterium]|nr:hypothetical protein [Clostridia bacterium]
IDKALKFIAGFISLILLITLVKSCVEKRQEEEKIEDKNTQITLYESNGTQICVINYKHSVCSKDNTIKVGEKSYLKVLNNSNSQNKIATTYSVSNLKVNGISK